MRKAVFVLVAALSVQAAAESTQQRIERVQRAIDALSEKGRFDRVRPLRYEVAEQAALIGNHALEARQYELLLASRPAKRERVRLFILLGRAREALREYGAAIQAYEDAVHDAPKSWEANMGLARTYRKVELHTRALEIYHKLLKMRPNDVQAYGETADAYQELGYLHKAVDYYQKALRLERRPEFYLKMADCYVRQDDLLRATETLQNGKSVIPEAEYHVRLGDILHRRRELDQAKLSWETALKADSRRDDVQLKLAMLYHRLGQAQDADRAIRRLAAQYPDSALVHFMRAWILYDRGEPEAAWREAKAAQRLAPSGVVQEFAESLLSKIRPSESKGTSKKP